MCFLRVLLCSSATVPKETFIAALIAARDPGPPPAATTSRASPATGIAQVGQWCEREGFCGMEIAW